MDTNISLWKTGKKSGFYVILSFLVQIGSVGLAQQYASQDGHFLDANPRLGSMGINPNARLDALVPRVNNNLYITGNITGGGSFQGIIPYRSPMEFQGALGSSTLSNFRRDSVGVNNLSSSLPARQPFVDYSRTLTGIRQRQVVRSHEFYQPKRVATTPFTVRNNLQYNQNLAMRPLEQPNFSLNVSKPRQFNPFKPLGAAGEKPEWLEGPTADLLQGKTPTETTPELIQPLVPGQGALAQSQNLLPSDLRIQPMQPLTDQQDVDQSVPSLFTSENRDLTGQTVQQEQELLGALGTGIGIETLAGGENPLAPTGTQLQERGKIDLSGMPPVGINSAMPGTGTPEEDSDQIKVSPLADLLPESSNLLPNQSSLKREKPSYWPKPFQPNLSVTGMPKTSLTPSGPSQYQSNFEAQSRQQFQANMQQAAAWLQKGRFYRAADAYSTAIVYDYASGAAHQGKAHALFGAGEYMSAAYFLYQALTLDPKLAKQRTDLRKLFADEKKFPSRLKELNDWQTKSNAAELKFLQGYVLYQIGSRDQAKTLLTDALILNPTLTAIRPILHAMAAEKK